MKAFLCLFLLTLTGCASTPFDRHEVIQRTVLQFEPVTNMVPVVTPQGTNIVEVVQPSHALTNFSTNVTFTVKPSWTTAIDTIRDVNSAANPTPSAPFVTIGLSLLSGLLAFIAKMKSDKAAVVPAIVAGVEAAGNDDVKKIIAAKAAQMGVGDRLHKTVKTLTP